MFGIAGLLIGVLSFPAFWLMGQQSPLLTIIAVAVPFAFVYPAVYGPEAALFSELFDTRVRYTGISFVYQFSGIFASGLTPIIATALLPLGGGQPWLICLYILVVSVDQRAVGLCDDGSARQRHRRRSEEGGVAPPGPTNCDAIKMDLNLKGRVAFVTGGGAGIGETIARVLAARRLHGLGCRS